MSYCTLHFWLGYSGRKLIRQTDHVFLIQICVILVYKNHQLHETSCFWRELDLKDEITGKGVENNGHCGAQTSEVAAFKFSSS